MRSNQRGFTMVELIMVTTIIAILFSMISPKFALLTQKAHQAKSRSNLAVLRSAVNIYYTDKDGEYPLINEPGPFPSGPYSLIGALHPKYLPVLQPPKLLDYNPSYNGLGVSYDKTVPQYIKANPAQDVFIQHAAAGPTTAPWPYGYNNTTGELYINNFNLDTYGNPFYTW